MKSTPYLVNGEMQETRGAILTYMYINTSRISPPPPTTRFKFPILKIKMSPYLVTKEPARSNISGILDC